MKFICSAAAAPSGLYIEGDGAFEFQRTVSRLMEMQSPEYLGAWIAYSPNCDCGPSRAQPRLRSAFNRLGDTSWMAIA